MSMYAPSETVKRRCLWMIPLKIKLQRKSTSASCIKKSGPKITVECSGKACIGFLFTLVSRQFFLPDGSFQNGSGSGQRPLFNLMLYHPVALSFISLRFQ